VKKDNLKEILSFHFPKKTHLAVKRCQKWFMNLSETVLSFLETFKNNVQTHWCFRKLRTSKRSQNTFIFSQLKSNEVLSGTLEPEKVWRKSEEK